MFGYSSDPTKLFTYAAKAPSVGLEDVKEQMFKANRYRNALVALELERRKRTDEALRGLSKDLVEVEKSLAEAEKEEKRIRDEIAKGNAKARRKVVSPEARKKLQEVRNRVKSLRSSRKSIRVEVFQSEAWTNARKAVEDWASAEQKRLRASSGLYWGTYLHVEHSCSRFRKGSPPRFKPWRGDGHLAMQIQHGISPGEAESGEDSRVTIKNSGGKWSTVRFRIGSRGPKKIPVFAEVSVYFHRPLPRDASIKWVHLICRRLATHEVWEIQFTVSRKEGWPKEDAATSGAVGIDLGWRLMQDGSLRVAYWKGSDGKEGELRLPPDWISEMRRVFGIRSHRDNLFNAMKAELSSWIKSHEGSLTDWLREATATLPQWRSENRLAALVLRWRKERFTGDDDMYRRLDERCQDRHPGRPHGDDTCSWRVRDKHLYEFEANLRDQLLSGRANLYRNFCADMRRRYKTAVLEDMDLRDFHVLPGVEDPSPEGAIREHVQDAALHVLRGFLAESMTEIVKVPAKNTTKRHSCGSIENWDRKQLFHACSRCGETYDQDAMAALNLLEAGTANAQQATASK